MKIRDKNGTIVKLGQTVRLTWEIRHLPPYGARDDPWYEKMEEVGNLQWENNGLNVNGYTCHNRVFELVTEESPVDDNKEEKRTT